ncbi:MLV-related proviral Env polyprotein-like isoform X3 [Moschus berezovskii]|uniref:MLV-related proviral Env polyprotein-like isoform X3 n=1 Tax=Moschus berezovskii TaxID=68408 RepID=UPI002443C7CB|nr:MLV-related proviral Env polyprotein-like isoform X3 [Moschus berezovskii]XP_055290575.1 MLV-related proviral Env polyprotein-like isoform X3 [Moschus berezovskii]
MPCHSRRTRQRPDRMEGQPSPVKSPKAENHTTRSPLRLVVLLLMTTFVGCGTTSGNPHQPVKVTWKLQNGLTGEILNSTTENHPPNTWWPILYFNLKDLIEGATWTGGLFQVNGFWACPGYMRNWKTCGGTQHYWCSSWSCVTSNDGKNRWDIGNRDGVNFSFVERAPNGYANSPGPDGKDRYAQVKVMFNQEAARKLRWTSGLSWGIQTSMRPIWHGPYYGGVLTILQTIEPGVTDSVGPNLVKSQGLPKTSKTTPQGRKTSTLAGASPSDAPHPRTEDPTYAPEETIHSPSTQAADPL